MQFQTLTKNGLWVFKKIRVFWEFNFKTLSPYRWRTYYKQNIWYYLWSVIKVCFLSCEKDWRQWPYYFQHDSNSYCNHQEYHDIEISPRKFKLKVKIPKGVKRNKEAQLKQNDNSSHRYLSSHGLSFNDTFPF